jgi:hypothetical protein
MTLTVTDMFCGAGGSCHGAELAGGSSLCLGLNHNRLVPLDAVDLSTPEGHGQLSLLGGFRAECQGVCGV